MKKKLGQNTIIILNILSTLILQGLTFISAPIFSNVLGTNNYGIVSVYNTWVSILSTVFSLQAGGTIAVAKSNFPEEDQKKYQSSVLSLAVLAYTAFSILLLIIMIPMSTVFNIDFTMVIFALLHGIGLYCVNFANLKYTYEFRADLNLVISALTSVCTIAFSLFLIYQFPAEYNHWGRIIGQSLVYTVVGAVIFIIIYKEGRTIYNNEYWKFTLPIATPTIFHLLASLILGQSDRLMLQNMINNSSVGIYTLAATFAGVIHSLWSAFNNSWVGYYYEYTRSGESEKIIYHAKNYLEIFSIIVAGFMLLSKEVYYVFASKPYYEGIKFIPVFALGYFFVLLYSFPVNYEFYNKKTGSIAFVTMTAAFLNIVLNYLFIKRWGSFGAVIATAIAHAIQFVLHYMNAKRLKTDIVFPFKFNLFIPAICFILIVLVTVYTLDDFHVIRWLIGISLGALEMFRVYKRKSIF